MLIKGLPRDALVRTPESERGRDPWTAELELMAQLIEIVSIDVAGMRLRKPIKVPRPKRDKTAQGAARRAERAVAIRNSDNPYRAAIQAFGASQPSRLREGQDEGPAPRAAPVADRPDPAYRRAIQAFGASQPSRLRVVRDGEREGT